jgi:osmotically-inducible protein OsmY
MILPLHLPLATFDHQPSVTLTHASREWVDASLRRHPMTRHLTIRVREEDGAVVLEGQVPTQMDRQWAGSVAQHARGQGEVDNRLLVLDDLDGPQWLPIPKPSLAALAA